MPNEPITAKEMARDIIRMARESEKKAGLPANALDELIAKWFMRLNGFPEEDE